MRTFAWLLALALIALLPAAARADAPRAAASASDKVRAKELFEKGLRLLKADRLEEAVDAFRRSRRAYPTRGNTQNLALALKRLGRLGEAHEVMDALLSGFLDLPERERQLAEEELAELKKKTGAILVRGAAAGATVTVDGRERGKTPTRVPIRVTAGERDIRVVADGEEILEVAVLIVAGKTEVVEPPVTGEVPANAEPAPPRPSPGAPAPQKTPPKPRAPSTKAERPFRVAMRLGYGPGLGVVNDSSYAVGTESYPAAKLEDWAGEQISIALEVGYTVVRRLTVGLYLHTGWVSPGPLLCEDVAPPVGVHFTCMASMSRLGVQAIYQTWEGSSPWVGLGIGLESLTLTRTAETPDGEVDSELTAGGIDFAILQVGYDAVLGAPTTLGAFGSYSFGQYQTIQVKDDLPRATGGSAVSEKVDIERKGLHSWLTVGVRFGLRF